MASAATSVANAAFAPYAFRWGKQKFAGCLTRVTRVLIASINGVANRKIWRGLALTDAKTLLGDFDEI